MPASVNQPMPRRTTNLMVWTTLARGLKGQACSQPSRIDMIPA